MADDTVPVVCRDFLRSHPDFHRAIDGLVTNAVKPQLNATERKPIWNAPPGASFSGKENFDQWFRTVPGVNLLIAPFFSISPTGGSWTYPIDGLGFGNEGERHNYLFTCEIHTEFVYTGSADWLLRVGSDDDSWAFVNDQLVLDNGGVHSYRTKDGAEPAGLVIGETYALDVFFAERHLTKSKFTLESTLCIRCEAGFYDDCGICGGDNSTCLGCDGVPNSGLVVDACGVCGGNGVCPPAPIPSPSPTPAPCVADDTVPVLCRDFLRSHPDFHRAIDGLVTGAVKSQLNTTQRKPIWNAPPGASFTTAGNFDQWFRAVPGVNQLISPPFSISPTSGGWTYPIDGLGFGNEGERHNYLFTCELHL
ncbi:MAG: fibro-slime domain-containing protein [Actinobacteria bacterium]|nr:fibro-slime domain-containing protein [Actinomycetota bacterium]